MAVRQHRIDMPLRLVCVDRPGIGESSRQRSRTFAGWAEDTTAVADALGHR